MATEGMRTIRTYTHDCPLLLLVGLFVGSRHVTNAHVHSGLESSVCYGAPCQNGGQCVDVTSGLGEKKFKCYCAGGFEGVTCDKRVNPCVNAPCENGGECVPQSRGGYRCNCPVGFKGQQCETQTTDDPCESKPCGPNGICLPADKKFICECQSGYSGPRCVYQVASATDPPVIYVAPTNDNNDSFTSTMIALLIAAIVLPLVILLLVCFHCVRVSRYIAHPHNRQDDGSQVSWMEASNRLCINFICCGDSSKSYKRKLSITKVKTDRKENESHKKRAPEPHEKDKIKPSKRKLSDHNTRGIVSHIKRNDDVNMNEITKEKKRAKNYEKEPGLKNYKKEPEFIRKATIHESRNKTSPKQSTNLKQLSPREILQEIETRREKPGHNMVEYMTQTTASLVEPPPSHLDKDKNEFSYSIWPTSPRQSSPTAKSSKIGYNHVPTTTNFSRDSRIRLKRSEIKESMMNPWYQAAPPKLSSQALYLNNSPESQQQSPSLHTPSKRKHKSLKPSALQSLTTTAESIKTDSKHSNYDPVERIFKDFKLAPGHRIQVNQEFPYKETSAPHSINVVNPDLEAKHIHYINNDASTMISRDASRYRKHKSNSVAKTEPNRPKAVTYTRNDALKTKRCLTGDPNYIFKNDQRQLMPLTTSDQYLFHERKPNNGNTFSYYDYSDLPSPNGDFQSVYNDTVHFHNASEVTQPRSVVNEEEVSQSTRDSVSNSNNKSTDTTRERRNSQMLSSESMYNPHRSQSIIPDSLASLQLSEYIPLDSQRSPHLSKTVSSDTQRGPHLSQTLTTDIHRDLQLSQPLNSDIQHDLYLSPTANGDLHRGPHFSQNSEVKTYFTESKTFDNIRSETSNVARKSVTFITLDDYDQTMSSNIPQTHQPFFRTPTPMPVTKHTTMRTPINSMNSLNYIGNDSGIGAGKNYQKVYPSQSEYYEVYNDPSLGESYDVAHQEANTIIKNDMDVPLSLTTSTTSHNNIEARNMHEFKSDKQLFIAPYSSNRQIKVTNGSSRLGLNGTHNDSALADDTVTESHENMTDHSQIHGSFQERFQRNDTDQPISNGQFETEQEYNPSPRRNHVMSLHRKITSRGGDTNIPYKSLTDKSSSTHLLHRQPSQIMAFGTAVSDKNTGQNLAQQTSSHPLYQSAMSETRMISYPRTDEQMYSIPSTKSFSNRFGQKTISTAAENEIMLDYEMKAASAIAFEKSPSFNLVKKPIFNQSLYKTLSEEKRQRVIAESINESTTAFENVPSLNQVTKSLSSKSLYKTISTERLIEIEPEYTARSTTALINVPSMKDVNQPVSTQSLYKTLSNEINSKTLLEYTTQPITPFLNSPPLYHVNQSYSTKSLYKTLSNERISQTIPEYTTQAASTLGKSPSSNHAFKSLSSRSLHRIVSNTRTMQPDRPDDAIHSAQSFSSLKSPSNNVLQQSTNPQQMQSVSGTFPGDNKSKTSLDKRNTQLYDSQSQWLTIHDTSNLEVTVLEDDLEQTKFNDPVAQVAIDVETDYQKENQQEGKSKPKGKKGKHKHGGIEEDEKPPKKQGKEKSEKHKKKKEDKPAMSSEKKEDKLDEDEKKNNINASAICFDFNDTYSSSGDSDRCDIGDNLTKRTNKPRYEYRVIGKSPNKAWVHPHLVKYYTSYPSSIGGLRNNSSVSQSMNSVDLSS